MIDTHSHLLPGLDDGASDMSRTPSDWRSPPFKTGSMRSCVRHTLATTAIQDW